MYRKMFKALIGAVTRKLLASVDFWNFQEVVDSRLAAIESRLAAIESRLSSTELRIDSRLDKSEDRLNLNENRLNLIENPLNIHRGVLETFYNPLSSNLKVMEFVDEVKKILTLAGGIDAKLARFGDYGDGGYVIVDDLRKSDVLFSIGVGENVSFDQKCEIKLSRVILVDHTVPNFIPPAGNFEIIRKPLVPGVISEQGITIKQLLSSYPIAEDYILKIDIEGDEWNILNELESTDLLKFRQVVVEFHGLNEFVNFENKLSVLNKLTHSHVPIVVHANNQGTHRFVNGIFLPDVLEVTWVRSNSYTFHSEKNTEIHELLSPNSQELPNIWVDWIDGKL